MAAQAAIANNMANASTIGFRADRVSFDRLVLKGGGARSARAGRRGSRATPTARAGAIDPDRPRRSTWRSTAMRWIAVQAADGDGSLYPARRPVGRALGRAADRRRLPGAWAIGGPDHRAARINRSRSPATARSRSCRRAATRPAAGGRPDQAGRAPRAAETVKGLDNLLRVKGGGVLPRGSGRAR